MIKDLKGDRLTPTQAAKEILLDSASRASYWHEGFIVDVDSLTDRERQLIIDAIDKQWKRIQYFLGYHDWRLIP